MPKPLLPRPSRWEIANRDTAPLSTTAKDATVAVLTAVLVFGALRRVGSSLSAIIEAMIGVACAFLALVIFRVAVFGVRLWRAPLVAANEEAAALRAERDVALSALDEARRAPGEVYAALVRWLQSANHLYFQDLTSIPEFTEWKQTHDIFVEGMRMDLEPRLLPDEMFDLFSRVEHSREFLPGSVNFEHSALRQALTARIEVLRRLVRIRTPNRSLPT